MTYLEKLRLRKVLPDDLIHNPDAPASPLWHKEVLAECRRKAESGEEQFSDLETAKNDILRQIA